MKLSSTTQKISLTVGVTAMLLASTVAPTFAAPPSVNVAPTVTQATSSTLTTQDIKELRADFTRVGVPSEQQNQLIQKIQNGGIPDALIPGKKPVSTDRTETNRSIKIIDRYADGSYLEQEISNPSTIQNNTLDRATSSTRTTTPYAASTSLANCTKRSGSGYTSATNCDVAANWSGIMIIGFIADYQYTPSGGQINKVGLTTQNCRVASCSRPDLRIVRKTSSGQGPAVAHAQSSVNAGLIGSWEIWVELQVDRSGGRVVAS